MTFSHLCAVVTLTAVPAPHPDHTNPARAEVDRVIEHGFSDDDLVMIRAAPEHDPEVPCPAGSVLIEDPEGTLRGYPCRTRSRLRYRECSRPQATHARSRCAHQSQLLRVETPCCDPGSEARLSSRDDRGCPRAARRQGADRGRSRPHSLGCRPSACGRGLAESTDVGSARDLAASAGTAHCRDHRHSLRP